MKRKNLFGILLIGFICVSFTHSTYNRVKFVYDGDTILLETGESNDQRVAMAEKPGIWSQGTAKMEKNYRGNIKSYSFHRPGCAFSTQIRAYHLVKFDSRHKAFWEGFSPCKQCRP